MVPRLVAGAADEAVAVGRSVEEAAFALSSLARQRQEVAQVDLLDELGPRTVSFVAPDEDLADAAAAIQEPGLGKAPHAARTDLAAEAEG